MSTPNSNGETKLFGSVSSACASSEFTATVKQATATTSASFSAADLDEIKLSDLQFLNGSLEAARRRSGRSVSVSSSGSDSSSDDDGNDGDENVLDVVRRREERERDGRVKNELLEELCMECGVSDSFELAEQLFSPDRDARRRIARTTDQSGAVRQQDQTAGTQRTARAQAEPDASPRSQTAKAQPSSTVAPNATELEQFDASTLDLDVDFEWLRYVDPQLFELPASEHWNATASTPAASVPAAAANTPTITQLDGGVQSQQNVTYYTQLDSRQATQPAPATAFAPPQTNAQVTYPYRTDYPPAQAIYGIAQPQLVSSYSRCNNKRVPEWHSAASPSPLNSPARTAADTPYSNALAQAHAPHVAGFSTKRPCVDVPYRDTTAVVGEPAPQRPDSDESESEDDADQQHIAPVPPLVPPSVMTSHRAESGQLAPLVNSGAPAYTYSQRLPEPDTRANSYWQPTASAFMPLQPQQQQQPQPQSQSVAQTSMYYPPTATSTSTTWYAGGASNPYTPAATSQQCHNVNMNASMPYVSYDQTRAVRPDTLAGHGDPQQVASYSAASYNSYVPPTSDACCNYATIPAPPPPAAVGDPCAGPAAWSSQQDAHKAAQLTELRAHPYYALLRDLAETEIKFASVDARFNWRVLMLNLPTELNRLLNNFRLRNPAVDAMMQRRRELVAAGRASPHLDTVVFSAIQNAHASLIAKLRSKSLEAAAASGAALNCVPAPPTDCLSVNAPPRATGATLWPSAPVQASAPTAPTAALLHRTSADLAGVSVAERQLAAGMNSNTTVQHTQPFGWTGETPQTAAGLRTGANRPSQPQAQCTAQSSQPQQQPQSQTQQSQAPATTSASASAQPQASARKKSWLPDSSKAVLLNWLGRHLTNPYPSDDEKEQLAQMTGLQLSQVNYWFTNARRRILPKMLAVVHAHALQPSTLTPTPAHPHQATAAAASAVP